MEKSPKKEELERITECLSIYRSIAALMSIGNDGFRILAVGYEGIIVLAIAYLFALSVVVGGLEALGLTVVGASLLLSVSVINSKAGDIFEASFVFRERAKRILIRLDGTRRGKQLKRELKALQPIRVQAGSQYYLDRGVALSFWAAVAINTTGLLFAFR